MKNSNNYIPFLKFKVNEVAGLSALDPKLKENLTPFFDLARKDGMTKSAFKESVQACYKKAEKFLKPFPYIFIDTFDIPDAIAATGKPNCSILIDAFKGFNFVPVLGLDRAADHNSTIMSAKEKGKIKSDIVAIRFQPDEFSSFALIEEDLNELIDSGTELFKHWIFVFDCRVCTKNDSLQWAEEISSFINEADKKIAVHKYIITGSSVPSMITSIAKPSDESIVHRVELDIFNLIQSKVDCILGLGDYTIISPHYSDISIPKELMLSVTVPKVFYTYKNSHYVARGGRIKTKGYTQYDQICQDIVSKPFYRGNHYSWGDNFIKIRADGLGINNVTPSTILKPTICAHITYMALDYPK